MSGAEIDVLGIGNAIVDIISRTDDAFLNDHKLSKGHMQLIEADDVNRLYDAMGQAVEISGGSAANSCAGLASFGSKTAFIGKVADDQFGRVFAHDIRSIGVTYETAYAANDVPTACCLVLVTPDGERTMNTFLGASQSLASSDIDADLVSKAKISYLEGYLFDPEEAKQAFYHAADIASDAGRQVALSLSDSFCVDRHRDAFRHLIKNNIDILFANEEEILSLYQVSDFSEAVAAVREECALAALTRSAKGSVIITPDEEISVAAQPVDEVIDTTGAGDLYAAGFLHGIAQDAELAQCGRFGSIAAAEIISHIGARPEKNLAELAKSQL